MCGLTASLLRQMRMTLLNLQCCFLLFCVNRYEYHWADGTNIKKPIKCSAPKYIDYLMTWVQDQLDDETLFPSKIGTRDALVNVLLCLVIVCDLSIQFHLPTGLA